MASLHERLEQFAISDGAYIECGKCRGRITADDEYEVACDAENAGWTVTNAGRVLCSKCRPAKRLAKQADAKQEVE